MSHHRWCHHPKEEDQLMCVSIRQKRPAHPWTSCWANGWFHRGSNVKAKPQGGIICAAKPTEVIRWPRQRQSTREHAAQTCSHPQTSIKEFTRIQESSSRRGVWSRLKLNSELFPASLSRLCLFRLIEQESVRNDLFLKAVQTCLLLADSPKADLLIGRIFPKDSFQNKVLWTKYSIEIIASKLEEVEMLD